MIEVKNILPYYKNMDFRRGSQFFNKTTQDLDFWQTYNVFNPDDPRPLISLLGFRSRSRFSFCQIIIEALCRIGKIDISTLGKFVQDIFPYLLLTAAPGPGLA